MIFLFDCNSFSTQEVRERVAFSLSHPLNLPPQAAGGFSLNLPFSPFWLNKQERETALTSQY